VVAAGHYGTCCGKAVKRSGKVQKNVLVKNIFIEINLKKKYFVNMIEHANYLTRTGDCN